MYFKNIFKIILYILFLINLAIPEKCMADANFDTFLNQPFNTDCEAGDEGVYFTNENQTVRKIYFKNLAQPRAWVLGMSISDGNTLSYEYVDQDGIKGTEKIEFFEIGYRVIERVHGGVQQIKNRRLLNSNSDLDISQKCQANSTIFKWYQYFQKEVGKFDRLRALGYIEADVIDLIVSFDQYAGKKVFLKCWVHSVNSSGGSCRSDDVSQSVSLETKGIDKVFFRLLLLNCPYQSENQNRGYCRNLWVTATVSGSSVPRLEDLRPVD